MIKVLKKYLKNIRIFNRINLNPRKINYKKSYLNVINLLNKNCFQLMLLVLNYYKKIHTIYN